MPLRFVGPRAQPSNVFRGTIGPLTPRGLCRVLFAYEESLPAPDTAKMGEFLQSLPPEQYPLMSGLASDLMAGSPDERFEWGLDLLIAGLEAMALRERRRHQDG